MSFYYLIDFVFFVFLSFAIYYSYQKKIYIKIFKYFQIFLLITISAKFASFTGVYLQKIYLIKADTYTTLILIGFCLNIVLLLYFGKYLLKITDIFINNQQIKTLLAKIFTVIEIVVLSTFALYIVMQLYISKVYIYPIIKKSYSYNKIETFYKKFLSDEFVNMILNSDTGTNHKEIIFKSFKSSSL